MYRDALICDYRTWGHNVMSNTDDHINFSVGKSVLNIIATMIYGLHNRYIESVFNPSPNANISLAYVRIFKTHTE